MVKFTMKGFKPVEFKPHTLTLKRGGNLNKECPLISKDVWQEGSVSVATFVQIRTREPWLTQAVMGKSSRGDMPPGVLTELRHRVDAEEQRIRSGAPPETRPDNGETDPMDEMEVMEEPETIQPETKTLRSIARYAD